MFDLHITLTHDLPDEQADALGINEESRFDTYYEDGKLHIRLLTEEEADELDSFCPVTDVVCTDNCETCPLRAAVSAAVHTNGAPKCGGRCAE